MPTFPYKPTRWLVLALVFLATLSVFFCYTTFRGKATASLPAPSTRANSSALTVEVDTPRPGGLPRICLQPGTLEPFEAADLYAKVSGFLLEQNVDIGSHVQAGQVLARIWVPEAEKQVQQDRAEVARAEAKVEQMKAAITTAQADLGAATAAIALAEADLQSKTSHRLYRQKQRDRIAGLVDRMAIEAKLADEQQDQYQSALSLEAAAREAVNAAKQKKAAAEARLHQAHADLRYAQAEVTAAQARLEKSQVLLDYTIIRSPYTGVVTKRNFHRGDYIRSADAGGERVPILAVERTDRMRVVIQVPERDVPFVNVGDPAVVEVDALPGVVFKTQGATKVEVARLAASEDTATRMMRTEVHLDNPEGKLRRGMFGRVTLTLHPGEPTALRIPSAALTGKAEGGKGSVWLIQDGKAHLVPVRYGADNGSEIEILSGLTPTTRVIVRANGPVEEGSPVLPTDTISAKVADR